MPGILNILLTIGAVVLLSGVFPATKGGHHPRRSILPLYFPSSLIIFAVKGVKPNEALVLTLQVL